MAKIYIAGPITEIDPNIAANNFEQAARMLEVLGHTPLNPMAMVCQQEGRTYNEYLLDALRIVLLEADAVYMLPNSNWSKGACIERAIAENLGMPIYFHYANLPLGSDWPEKKTL